MFLLRLKVRPGKPTPETYGKSRREFETESQQGLARPRVVAFSFAHVSRASHPSRTTFSDVKRHANFAA